MGRIEEALRRAGLDKPAQGSSATPAGQVFVSAWPASRAAEAREAREVRDEVREVVRDLERPRNAILQEPNATRFHGFSEEWLARLVVPGNPNHMLVEQFRHLAGALHHAQSNGALKSLMVTSAVPGDGKTFTALNLALTLAGSYARRVLLIDADLRRPSIDQICGIRNTHGLSEALRSETEQKLPVFQLVEGLTFLPAGRPDPDPMSGLTSSRLMRILAEAAAQFDWVILDAPPATPLADAGLIGAMVDALLLVVRAGETQARAVEKAIEALGRDRIFGVVLNGVEQASFEYAVYSGDRSE
jgi:protein-tyrosine kinase